MSRKRNYIPLPEKLAAALACLLPQELRDDLRDRKVSSSTVLEMFQWDHIHLHSLGGSDAWENLNPVLVAVHKEKSRRDTSIAAKAKRIDKKWQEFTAENLSHPKPTKKPSKWPKQKIQSRGFNR